MFPSYQCLPLPYKSQSRRNGELGGTLEVVELDETGSRAAEPYLPDVCLNIFFKTLAKEIPHFWVACSSAVYLNFVCIILVKEIPHS